MTGWERQHGVEKTDRIWRRQVWWGFGVEGSQRQGWIEQTVRLLVHTGAASMWILQSGGQVRGWGREPDGGHRYKRWGAGTGAAAMVVQRPRRKCRQRAWEASALMGWK